jgi:hypothetical protein
VGLLEDLHAEEVASDLRVEDGVIEPDELDRLRPLQLLASRPVLDAQLGAAAAHPDPYPAYEGTPNDAAGVLCNTRDERQHALGCLEIDQPKSGSWVIACSGRIGGTIRDGHISASAFASPCG